jgi:glycosyltransferase involved in cell wall biosynthesis
MSKISCIIIARDEATNIRRCLESVSWADEIVLVDVGSVDDTKTIASRFTDKIFDLEWRGFGPAKEFARSQATGEWVFSLDADEVVTDKLREEIQRIVESANPASGYFVPRKSNFLGRWIRHGGWYPDLVLRLFRKDKGHFTSRSVHEEVQVEGGTGRLTSDLLHYTDPDFDHYLGKVNQYTTLDALELHRSGREAGLLDVLFRPPATFFKMYLFRAGFADGAHGLILAAASAFHVFSKYVKLWHLKRSTDEIESKDTG